MDRTIRFISKRYHNNWHVWIVVGYQKILLTNSLKSKEDVENFNKNLSNIPVDYLPTVSQSIIKEG